MEKINSLDLLFEAYLTQETTYPPGSEEIPKTKEPVWILGKKYNALVEQESIRSDIRSRIWCSYRRGFPLIGDSGYTSDKGWGCMLRCGQMVLAQALMFLHLGRDWRWNPSVKDRVYLKILRLFEDRRTAPFSIHQIALMGCSAEAISVGEWFGPNMVAQTLKRLMVQDEWCSLTIHIALDNMVVINDVKNECLLPKVGPSASEITGRTWRPLLLVVPLRLGITDINPLYIPAIKACFTLEQTLGLIGGKPNHALYFIGCIGDAAIHLDPHTTQPAVSIRNKETDEERKADFSYHCRNSSRLLISQMDPSIAMCFLCRTEAEFDSLCTLVKQRLVCGPYRRPLFEICQERAPDWIGTTGAVGGELRDWSFPSDSSSTAGSTSRSHSKSGRSTKRVNNSEDDFEFLG